MLEQSNGMGEFNLTIKISGENGYLVGSVLRDIN